MARPSKNYHKNFWAKVHKTACCWLWIGAKDIKSGGKDVFYGKIRFGYKQKSSHRASWEISNGPIPEGRMVLHQCDVPLCVNPSHLYLGDSKDNVNDVKHSERTKRIHRLCFPTL